MSVIQGKGDKQRFDPAPSVLAHPQMTQGREELASQSKSTFDACVEEIKTLISSQGQSCGQDVSDNVAITVCGHPLTAPLANGSLYSINAVHQILIIAHPPPVKTFVFLS